METFVPTKDTDMHNMEQFFKDESRALKLTLSAIKVLHKRKTNKFLLPLRYSDKNALLTWNTLVTKPFRFLSRNGAMFSLDFEARSNEDTYIITDGQEEFEWIEHNLRTLHNYRVLRTRISDKVNGIVKKTSRLKEMYETLDVQITGLKAQFESRVDQYHNPKLLRFMASRTTSNIKTIRIARALAERKLQVLAEKRLVCDPDNFFKRAIKLYLGETGTDILNDMDVLGFNTTDHYKVGIEYLFFLMGLIEHNNNKYVSPIIVIFTSDKGFKNRELLKVFTGHMFINSMTLSKDFPAPLVFDENKPKKNEDVSGNDDYMNEVSVYDEEDPYPLITKFAEHLDDKDY